MAPITLSNKNKMQYAKLAFSENVLPFHIPDHKQIHIRSRYGIAPLRNTYSKQNKNYFKNWGKHVKGSLELNHNLFDGLRYDTGRNFTKHAQMKIVPVRRGIRANYQTYQHRPVLQHIL